MRNVGLISIILALLTWSFEVRAEGYPPWKVGLSYELVSNGIDFTPHIGKTADTPQKLTYRPSQSNYAGVIVGYKWAATTISFAVPASQEIRAKEGESDYLDYHVSYYVRRWGIEANYNQFKGYLIENSSQLSAATLNGQTYYRLPEMKAQGYGANFLYVFSPEKYSMPAALDQSEPQNKSGGSWIGISSFRTQRFINDAGIFPAEKAATFGTDGSLIGLRTTLLAAGGGYGYLWDGPAAIFGSIFGGATIGANQLRYDLAGIGHDRVTAQVNAHLRGALGINGRRGFFKLAFVLDYFNYKTPSIDVGNSVSSALLTGGFRL